MSAVARSILDDPVTLDLLAERFAIVGDCWLWRGSQRRGYGRFKGPIPAMCEGPQRGTDERDSV